MHQVLEEAPTVWPYSACLVLDLEKAFNTLNWEYMFMVMWKVGIEGRLVKITQLLYAEPVARAKTGRLVSTAFPIGRGMCQGCLLSPFLFACQWSSYPVTVWLALEHTAERWDTSHIPCTRCLDLHKEYTGRSEGHSRHPEYLSGSLWAGSELGQDISVPVVPPLCTASFGGSHQCPQVGNLHFS